LGIVANRANIKILEKHARAQFTTTWTPIAINKVGDKFHQNFQVGLQVNPHRYMGVNLGCTTWVQQ
jgi:hypothetical protein